MEREKITQAEALMVELKKLLLQITWGDKRYAYNGQKLILPWLHEDYQYSIKKLNLSRDKEDYYLEKIERIIGEYAEFY
ncbi:hypothetical protein [Salinivirga cyanobacteriivorans]